MSRICPRCFHHTEEEKSRCSRCGFDLAGYNLPEGALEPLTILQGRFLAGIAADQDKISFFYTGLDLETRSRVLIREFFDPQTAHRPKGELKILPIAGREEIFIRQRSGFEEMVKSRVQSRAGGAVGCFKENHTIYLILEREISGQEPQRVKRILPKEEVNPAPPAAQGQETPQNQKPPRKKEGEKRAAGGIIAALLCAAALASAGLNLNWLKEQLPFFQEEKEDGREPEGEAEREPEREPGAARDYSPGMTVMIYMVGSDLERLGGEGTYDLSMIQTSGIDLEQNPVLVCAGGCTDWKCGLPTDRTVICRMDSEGLALEEEHIGTDNMGDAGTLSEFVNWCTGHYPNGHYMLTFWDHGGGPLFGFGMDELHADDSLELSEMAGAMEATGFSGEKKLDLVLFDCCLMQTLELGHIWADYADYMIGSQEPSYSINQSLYAILNETSDPERIARTMIDGYFEKYEDPLELRNLTFSCLDLSGQEKLESAFDDLMGALAGELSKSGIGEAARLIEGTRTAGAQVGSWDCYDLADFCEAASARFPKEAGAVKEALSLAVKGNKSSFTGMNGLSVYLPYIREDVYLALGAGGLADLGACRGQSDFIRSFSPKHFSGSETDWQLSEPSIEGGALTLSLSEAQLEDAAGLFYSVLCDNGNGSFSPIQSLCRLALPKDGRIVLPLDQKLVRICIGSGDSVFVPYSERERIGEGALCKSDPFSAKGAEGAIAGLSPGDLVSVDFYRDYENPGIIYMGLSREGEAGSGLYGGRNDLSISDLSGLSYEFESYLPVRGPDGQLLPHFEWPVNGGGGRSGRFPIEEDTEVWFEESDLTGSGMPLAVQLLIRDLCGDWHAGELIQVSQAD